MIKFFRQFRQHMIKENRVSRYLLYAIGEIILVVIGILIALEINDRSGARKLQRTNVMLMERMQAEHRINIDRLQYLDTEYHYKGEPFGLTAILARIDTGLTYIDAGLDRERMEWLLSKTTFYSGGRYNMSSAVYHEILNSGHFYSLGPDSLTDKIQRYYQLIDREEHYAEKANQTADSDWDDCKYGFNDLKAEYDRRGPQVIAECTWYLDHRSTDHVDLKMAMRRSYTSTERNRRHARTMIDEANALIEALETEIRSKK